MPDIEPLGAPGEGTIATDETDRLIASDRVAGTEVFDRAGERIGSIYNFMVDKVTGQVAYVVMSFGGFLGLGEHFQPLPWTALTYDPGRRGYVVDRAAIDGPPSSPPQDARAPDAEGHRTIFGAPGSDTSL